MLVACLWSLVAASAANAASAAPVAAEKGMVVSAQHLATEVGVNILKRGGSAIDAAVAVGYALAVVYPAAGNLGGGGFMTIVFADGRKTFIDFREKAPRAATPGHVPGQGRKRHQGPEHERLAGGRRPRHRVGPGVCAEKVRDDDAGSVDRAGDRTGRGWIHPGAGRRRHARLSDRGFQAGSGGCRDFSQQGTAFCGRPKAGAA